MIDIKRCESSYSECAGVVKEHANSLLNTLDSWMEEALLGSDIYKFNTDGRIIGYCCIKERTLKYFYIVKQFFVYAATLLEKVVEDFNIKEVMVATTDSALCALMGEWDFDTKRSAWIFCDSERNMEARLKNENVIFRLAKAEDCDSIREMFGDFFDDDGYEYTCLEERIEAKTVFLLEQKDKELLGGGIIEIGRVCKDNVSIGMITNRAHRQKGVARTMLLSLKEYV